MAYKKTADFAENQTKFLLKDLNNQNHATRLKGLKRYQEYIELNRPDVSYFHLSFFFYADIDV
jgi:hypothetical protein